MIDEHGFRLNVGIILCNQQGRVFFGQRVGNGKQDIWQFPQGGIKTNETPDEAMYRELMEEIGLAVNDVEVMAVSQRWLSYRLPKHLRRYSSLPLCIGQKQKWFLLKLLANEQSIRFDVTDSPEFDGWNWVDYWLPVEKVIAFKRRVYQQALQEFKPLVTVTIDSKITS